MSIVLLFIFFPADVGLLGARMARKLREESLLEFFLHYLRRKKRERTKECKQNLGSVIREPIISSNLIVEVAGWSSECGSRDNICLV